VRYAKPARQLVNGRLVALDGVTDVAVGRKHTCVVRSNAGVYCWGTDTHGQLGVEAKSPYINEPTTVVPMFDDRVFARTIEADDDEYYSGQDIGLTGFGFEPGNEASVQMRAAGGEWSVIDGYVTTQNGEVDMDITLANNQAQGLYELRLWIVGTGYSNVITFTVLVSDDHGNTPSSATVINALPATVNGTLSAGDLDWFSYTATSSGDLLFQTTGATDTFCEYFVGMQMMDRDDDGGAGTNCLLAVSAVEGTEYRFKVRHYNAQGGAGPYTVSLTAP
jgi:hypothetical protein